jgi:hypothetical protein
VEPLQDQTPAAHLASRQAEGYRVIEDVFLRSSATVSRWPLYLRQVKQILRTNDESFDERRYGFSGLVEALRHAQREGLFRLDRDRQGVLRVYPGARLQRVAPAASPAPSSDAPTTLSADSGDATLEPQAGVLFGEPTTSSAEVDSAAAEPVNEPAEAVQAEASSAPSDAEAQPEPDVEVARAPRRRSTTKKAAPPARKNAAPARPRGKSGNAAAAPRSRRPRKGSES